MYFDRFDIAEAYYCFASAYLTGVIPLRKTFRRKPQSEMNEFVCFCRKVDEQLERLRFKPRLSLYGNEPKALSENGKVIYMALVHKYFGIH